MSAGRADKPVRRGAWSATPVPGLAALGLLFALPIGAAAALAAETGGDRDVTAQVQRQTPIPLPSLSPLVERVSPAVVTISAQVSGETAQAEPSTDESDRPGWPFDDLLRRFFEDRGLPQPNREMMALGSGFVIDPAGYIVTNNHVVGNAAKITVILQDNSRHLAKIVGRDEKTDLALIKIDTKDKLHFVTWGNSDEAKVGDWVVAVGNPFGLGGTVTAGIISAMGRNINEGPYDDFIQIDAPINRGNSGGPTFNLSGEVIGINTAIYSPSGGSVGIGFAVPSATARNVIAQLKETGHVTRGWLGVAVQAITPAIAKGLGINPDQPVGALVASVTPDSPAAKAGIRQGDVITQAGGHPIKSVHDLPRLVAATPVGQVLDLTVRRDGKEERLAATIGQMPEPQQRATTVPGGDAETAGSLGLRLSSLTPRLRREYRIPDEVDGVVVTRVAPDSQAARLGLEPGDVIVAIDQRPARSPQEAVEALTQGAAKGTILLLLNRHGINQFVGWSVTPGVGSSKPR
jgi:serine protease Do